MIKTIKIYDFDGTLVNTPEKPQGWKGGWWGKDVSLLPPFMPHYLELKNHQHLLNQKVVDAYLESKTNPEIHTVMMTGRHWGLRKHVMNILFGYNLCTKEDCEKLKEESNQFIFISGGRTLEGKLERMTELFKEFSEVNYIEMWEDRQEHIPHFRNHGDVLRRIRNNFKGITVYEPPNWG